MRPDTCVRVLGTLWSGMPVHLKPCAHHGSTHAIGKWHLGFYNWESTPVGFSPVANCGALLCTRERLDCREEYR